MELYWLLITICKCHIFKKIIKITWSLKWLYANIIPLILIQLYFGQFMIKSHLIDTGRHPDTENKRENNQFLSLCTHRCSHRQLCMVLHSKKLKEKKLTLIQIDVNIRTKCWNPLTSNLFRYYWRYECHQKESNQNGEYFEIHFFAWFKRFVLIHNWGIKTVWWSEWSALRLL